MNIYIYICSTSLSGGNQVDGLPPASSFMKNDILKISGVNFSKCSYFWPAVWAFEGFRGNFKHFNERMQKKSPRGSGSDHFRHSSKLNLEATKNDEDDDFSDFYFESTFKARGPRGLPKAFLVLLNDS